VAGGAVAGKRRLRLRRQCGRGKQKDDGCHEEHVGISLDDLITPPRAAQKRFHLLLHRTPDDNTKQ
jgi:hypothetical protein